MNQVKTMQNLSKVLIALFFVVTGSMADIINAEFSKELQSERLYQTQSTDSDSTDNDSNEDSSGTPIDLILEVEPEC
ncbi:MAG: hypothetical protein OXE56_10380 [Gammaproteobacteria bacterium]|nr:hypothetical protein [Gammaproteobacteria bacterium]